MTIAVPCLEFTDKEALQDDNQTDLQANSSHDMNAITHNTVKSSARTKKPPSVLYDDFLW
jgi:hypothetical protein